MTGDQFWRLLRIPRIRWNLIHSEFLALSGADMKDPGGTEEFHREFQGIDGDEVGGKGLQEKVHEKCVFVRNFIPERGKSTRGRDQTWDNLRQKP